MVAEFGFVHRARGLGAKGERTVGGSRGERALFGGAPAGEGDRLPHGQIAAREIEKPGLGRGLLDHVPVPLELGGFFGAKAVGAVSFACFHDDYGTKNSRRGVSNLDTPSENLTWLPCFYLSNVSLVISGLFFAR
jgi:hypothetical protein